MDEDDIGHVFLDEGLNSLPSSELEAIEPSISYVIVHVQMWNFLLYLCLTMCLHDELVGLPTISNEDYKTVCGTAWQSKYSELHRSILSGKASPRYLVSVPVKEGLADLSLGYVSAFLWALITNRAYMVMHVDKLDNCDGSDVPCKCNQRSIEHAYHSPNIDIKAPQLNWSQYRCLMPPYQKKFLCNVTQRIQYRPTDQHSSRILTMNQVNQGFREEFLITNMTRFPRRQHDAEIYLLATNRGITYDIFDNPFHSAYLQSIGLRRETAFPCIFNYLFERNDDVCIGECKNVETQLLECGRNGTIRIGIQVRDVSAADAVEHFYCAESLLWYYQNKGVRVVLLLITASSKLQLKMRARYGEKLLLPNGVPSPIVGVSLEDETKRDSENVTKEECDRKLQNSRQGMLDAARDTYLLSMTDMQILSRRSGFGVMGGMSRPRKDPIMFRVAMFDTKDPDLRMCNTTLGGDSLAIFAHSWSGL